VTKLLGYDYEIIYRSWKENSVADRGEQKKTKNELNRENWKKIIIETIKP
jgi:hypothetical protein